MIDWLTITSYASLFGIGLSIGAYITGRWWAGTIIGGCCITLALLL